MPVVAAPNAGSLCCIGVLATWFRCAGATDIHNRAWVVMPYTSAPISTSKMSMPLACRAASRRVTVEDDRPVAAARSLQLMVLVADADVARQRAQQLPVRLGQGREGLVFVSAN